MNNQAVSSQFSRRKFVKTVTASTAVLGFPAITRSKSPNGKLNIGLIGVGGPGRSHVNACRYEDIVALCDVNANSLKGALKTAPEARTYKDLRDFFGKLEDIDEIERETNADGIAMAHVLHYGHLTVSEIRQHCFNINIPVRKMSF